MRIVVLMDLRRVVMNPRAVRGEGRLIGGMQREEAICCLFERKSCDKGVICCFFVESLGLEKIF